MVATYNHGVVLRQSGQLRFTSYLVGIKGRQYISNIVTSMHNYLSRFVRRSFHTGNISVL